MIKKKKKGLKAYLKYISDKTQLFFIHHIWIIGPFISELTFKKIYVYQVSKILFI